MVLAAAIFPGMGSAAEPELQRHAQLSPQQPQQGSEAASTPDLETGRARLKLKLVEAAATVQTLEATLTTLEERISAISAQASEVQAKLFGQRGKMATLLSALLKMGRNPPPPFVTHPDDALKMVRSAILMATRLPELKDEAESLSKDLDQHQRLKAEATETRERFAASAAQIREAQTRLSALVQTRNAQAMSSAHQELANLTQNASDLNDLIAKLNISVPLPSAPPAPSLVAPPPVPIIVTAPAAIPVPPKIAEAAAGATPAAPLPPVVEAVGGANPAAKTAEIATRPVQVAALPPALKPGVIEVAPSELTVSAANAARIAPAIRFGDARSKLPLPAQGRFVASFGEATQHGGKSKGIVIETRRGAQITSPCDGWVLYANEFRSYGQLLIINAGDGYLVLLAGMSQVDVQPGQFVLASEPVGTMTSTIKGDSARSGGKSPVLYVEFRKDGRPVDPTPWWAISQQKVQG